MDWITDQIAIGNYREAGDRAALAAQRIRSVLSLDGTLSTPHAAGLGVVEVVGYRLIDGEGNDPRIFRLAIDDLQRLIEVSPPVLVHCHAGRSRSAAVVAAYLMRAHHLRPDETLARVASKRAINITPELLELLDP
jgi:atypical dual specificity phosphatase